MSDTCSNSRREKTLVHRQAPGLGHKIKSAAKGAVAEPLKEYISNPDRYPNFRWSLNWVVTHRCNLNCDYCHDDHKAPNPDVMAAAKKIIAMRPYEIVMTGGDPMQAPGFAEIVKYIYESLGDPRLVINTNLVYPLDKLKPTLPYLHGLLTSIDGLGDDNKKHRHSRGEFVLKQVKELDEYIMASGREIPGILVNGTLTPYNFGTVSLVAQKLYEINPRIKYTVSTVDPYWDPLSLYQHPEQLQKCSEMLMETMEQLPNLQVFGLLDDYIQCLKAGEKPLEEDSSRMNKMPEEIEKGDMDTNACVSCVRQFFWGYINEHGEFSSCKSSFHNRLLFKKAKEMFRKGKATDGLKQLGRAADHAFINKANDKCYMPCKCDFHVEQILRNPEGQPVHPLVKLWTGRIDKDRLEEGVRFLKEKLGIDYSKEAQEILLKRE